MELTRKKDEMPITFENLSISQKVRASLHRDVRAICTETCHFLGLEVTKPAMEIVAELVYKKLSVYGTDLEAFSKHAKRTTINSEDVKLLVRRNVSLKNHLNTLVLTNPVISKDKRRKTAVPAAKPPETPASKSAANLTKNKETNLNIEGKDTVKEDRPPDDNLVENMLVDDVMIDLTFD